MPTVWSRSLRRIAKLVLAVLLLLAAARLPVPTLHAEGDSEPSW